MPRFMDAQSVLICSGVLNTRLAEVRAAIEGAHLTICELTEENDWCCFTARR